MESPKPNSTFSNIFCDFIAICLKKIPEERMTVQSLLRTPFIRLHGVIKDQAISESGSMSVFSSAVYSSDKSSQNKSAQNSADRKEKEKKILDSGGRRFSLSSNPVPIDSGKKKMEYVIKVAKLILKMNSRESGNTGHPIGEVLDQIEYLNIPDANCNYDSNANVASGVSCNGNTAYNSVVQALRSENIRIMTATQEAQLNAVLCTEEGLHIMHMIYMINELQRQYLLKSIKPDSMTISQQYKKMRKLPNYNSHEGYLLWSYLANQLHCPVEMVINTATQLFDMDDFEVCELKLK
jgi:hypothetical protein